MYFGEVKSRAQIPTPLVYPSTRNAVTVLMQPFFPYHPLPILPFRRERSTTDRSSPVPPPLQAPGAQRNNDKVGRPPRNHETETSVPGGEKCYQNTGAISKCFPTVWRKNRVLWEILTHFCFGQKAATRIK